MGKFTNLNRIKEQAELIETLADRVNGDIGTHCEALKNYPSNGRTTETAEPQPDGIQFRTVDDLGRICIPKDIRDKLGITPGTECAVYATDELTNEEIIVIRRNKNEKTPQR